MMQEPDSGATRRHGTRPTVAVAESCTGGLLMARLVGIPESGDWFKGGLVAYHPEVKVDLLGVDPGPVVTARAAEQMADGVRRLLGTEIGISTTGVAGPKTEENRPVGMVFIALSGTQALESHQLQLHGDPDQIRAQAVQFALDRLELAAG